MHTKKHIDKNSFFYYICFGDPNIVSYLVHQSQIPAQVLKESTMTPTNTTALPESNTKIPAVIWILGSGMFLINLSFMMVFALSTIYFKEVLGYSGTWVSMIQNVGEMASYLMKLFSGIISDYLKNRKMVMIAGYAFTFLSRLFLAASSSVFFIIASKFLERIGNGIQGTPRDALVSDVAPPEKIASCFGLKRALAITGSCIGGLLGMYAMMVTDNDFSTVFYLATIPAFIALIVLIVFVHEPPHLYSIPQATREHSSFYYWLQSAKRLKQKYWLLMLLAFIFTSARVPEGLLTFLARDSYGWEIQYVPLITVFYNIFYALGSYPAGILGDRINRYGVLTLGILCLAIADLFIMFGSNNWTLAIALMFWGTQIAIMQNVFMALISDMVPEDLRGTGFGIFYLVSAIASLVAGFMGGQLWDHVGPTIPYLYSLVVTLGGFLILWKMIGSTKVMFQSRV
jgi:MFS family permease